MRVAINTQPLSSGHKTRGMGQYTFQLLNALKKIEGVEIFEFTNINQLSNVDLVHYPFFDLFFTTLPLNKKFPTVVTVPDVTPLVFPKHYPPGIKGSIKNEIQTLSLKGAKAIITFSKSSKDDIEKKLKIKDDRIFPIYLAPSNDFKVINDQTLLKDVQQNYNLPEEFGLFVGSVNWNKNLLNLSEACLKANVKLVLIGKNFESKKDLNHPEMRSYKQFIEKYSQNPNIKTLGFVENEDLVAIYNLASFLLLPSYYEGFGLPILEAQVSGCPVLTSNISSMPEVAGKGAIYVNPYSVEDIVRGIREVEENREKSIKTGFENVKRFSLEKCARETLEVYKYAFKH